MTPSVEGLALRCNDGTPLLSDVYLPQGRTRVPLILLRSPYDRTSSLTQKMIGVEECLDRGYGVVLQDTRGRFGSGGSFDPFHQEIADGHETVEWLADQSFASGEIFMAGSSYVGATQWLAAMASPPHLAGIAPSLTASDIYEGWMYQGGAFQLAFNLFWALVHLLPEEERRRLGLPQEPRPVTPAYRDEVDDTSFAANASHSLSVAGKWLHTLPLTSVDPLHGDASFYADWLWNQKRDDVYWSRISAERNMWRVRCPVLSVSGWYQLFVRGAYEGHRYVRSTGGTEMARRRSRLIIGPWENSLPGPRNTTSGILDFGPSAGLEFTATQLEFFDSILEQRPVDGTAQVSYFTMGANEWSSVDTWPPPRTAWRTLFLRSNGRLHDDPPAGNEGYDETGYDPANPVPTLGGATVPGLPQGPQDHSALDARGDCAVYRSEPLDAPVTIAGPVRVIIEADRTAPSTDITATLSLEQTDGIVINVCDGITRWSEGPGSARVEIDLLASAIRVPPGDRIHLRISHSNFPRFDRNLCTGEPMPLASRMGTCQHRIHHGR
ncbi:MAG: CocE/NonD family hydrolase, partial [Acidimicrobiales bacterium]